ncbi:DUF1600 domain-containing protein [Malacoplasma penetrans]
MIVLLNSLSPILDIKKLKQFLFIIHLKNLFFGVLYILNYLFILLIFIFKAFQINGLINIMNPIFPILVSVGSFLVILLLHAFISRIINLFIKKIVLKDID